MGTSRLEALSGAIDDLLSLDPAELDDDELHDTVIGLLRQSHRLAATRARLISMWDRRGLWARDGSRSAGHRLAREASMSIPAGKREVSRARALRSMPHTSAAVAQGALSAEHVDVLAGANKGRRQVLFESHEETLVEQAKLLRFGDCCRMVEYWKQCADAAATEDEAARRHEARNATAATTIDDMVDLRALLDPLGGAIVVAELNRLMEQQRRADKRTGTVRTAAQRRADALVEMATRSRTARPGGLRPRPLLTILTGDDTFARVCELADGTVIAPGQIVPLLSEADIERVVFDGPDRVISVSRRRTFTGALRRAIEVRDRHCQHPSGCDEPADRCDVDHIQPYSDGGPTSLDNGDSAAGPTTATHTSATLTHHPTLPADDPTNPTNPTTEHHPTRAEPSRPCLPRRHVEPADPRWPDIKGTRSGGADDAQP